MDMFQNRKRQDQEGRQSHSKMAGKQRYVGSSIGRGGFSVKGKILFLSVLICLFFGNAESAYAGRIPIVWGHGEKVAKVGDLSPEVYDRVAAEFGNFVTVGFLYDHAHVYWLDLWTWNGRYVLYSGDRYCELDATEWQNVIGGDPSVIYGKPILYRMPLLPTLLVVVVVGAVVRRSFFRTEQEKLEDLMDDKRYQRAIQVLFDTDNHGESAKFVTTLDERKLLCAVNDLIGDGIEAAEADANLRKIAESMLATNNAQIDGAFAAASQLDQQCKWDESAEIYSQLVSSLPADDERLIVARNCLASINDKRSANAKEHSGEPEPQQRSE